MRTQNNYKIFAQNGNTGIGMKTPGSTLTVNGSFAATYKNINAATYVLLVSDYYLAWNGSSTGTVTLPAAKSGAGNFSGRVYHIKNTSTNSSLTIAGNGSELIDNLGGLITLGYTGSGYSNVANTSFYSKATQNWTPTASGSSIYFQVTANNTTAPTRPLMIDQNGRIGVNMPVNQTPPIPRTALDVNGAVVIGGVGAGNIPNMSNATLVSLNLFRSGLGESEFTNYLGTGTGGFRFFSIANTGTPEYSANAITYIDANGVYSVTSDARAMTNIHTLSRGLKKIMAIHPVSYNMHTSKLLKNGVSSFGKGDKVTPSLGFLAQDLYKIVPEAVTKPKDEANKFYTVSYSTIIPVLTRAIQEQQAQIEILKKQNTAAAKQYIQLVERVNQMEQKSTKKKTKNNKLVVK